MKLDLPKEWYEKSAELEGDSEVGAGGGLPWTKPRLVRRTDSAVLVTRIVLGSLLALWRRNQGLNMERLAEQSGVPFERLLEIEREPDRRPDAADLRKLANFLGVPAVSLLELAGLTKPPTRRLREQALRFAVSVEPVKALDANEREALENFMSALKQEATQAG
ncbi:MAG: helix-turn-helix transcriptional regulator [Verrucomicrobia bacterium]|nr:helix-turn-helix transcriptional regulator [Verrucomicrobiota bacterium]